jgi:hypothetical protein
MSILLSRCLFDLLSRSPQAAWWSGAGGPLLSSCPRQPSSLPDIKRLLPDKCSAFCKTGSKILIRSSMWRHRNITIFAILLLESRTRTGGACGLYIRDIYGFPMLDLHQGIRSYVMCCSEKAKSNKSVPGYGAWKYARRTRRFVVHDCQASVLIDACAWSYPPTQVSGVTVSIARQFGAKPRTWHSGTECEVIDCSDGQQNQS